MIRYAPSSTPLRPSFQVSSTRMPNCSISSGWVVGSMSTAIWLPFFASKAASFDSMLATAPPDSVPVRSITRALSGGTGTCACASVGVSAQQIDRAIAAWRCSAGRRTRTLARTIHE